MFEFGKRSNRFADGVDDKLFTCAKRALSKSKYDMMVAWRGGLRTAEIQKELYDLKKSKADGYEKLSYHQTGNALDLIPVSKDEKEIARAYNHFAQLMFKEWQTMLKALEVTETLNWGGLFGSTGWDKPHWEVT